MNVVLFEPKWHKMVCRQLVLVETKFKRCLFCGSMGACFPKSTKTKQTTLFKSSALHLFEV